MHDMAGPVSEDLDLDMPGAGNERLDIHIAAAEGGLCFGAAARIGRFDPAGFEHRPRTAPAAARKRLYHHGAARPQLVEEGLRLFQRNGAVDAFQHRDSRFTRRLPRLRLVPEKA